MNHILEAKDIQKSFGRCKILKNINFEIEAGQIVGLLGPNGVGKTTLMKIICGLLTSDAGTITIGGYYLEKNPCEYLSQIGMIIEQPALYYNMDAYMNMLLQARLYGAPDKNRIHKLLSRFELDNVGKKKIKNFSLGMKQRLGIAMALYSNPKLLILDEPMNGLDPEGIMVMRDLLRDVAKEGVAVLVSSHILTEIERLCSNIIIMNDGYIKNVVTNENTVMTSELEKVYIETMGEEVH